MVRQCQFCDSPTGAALCSWPSVRRSEVLVEDLKVGDLWIREGKGVKIVEIEDFDLTRKFWIASPRHKDALSFNRFRGDLQLVERVQTCNNPCCFRHRRRIDADHYYCMDHWSAWETVS